MDTWRKNPDEWRRYPYVVREFGDGWGVTWHHKTGGVSHEIVHGMATPEAAMEMAEQHAEKHGWKPCDPRND